MSAFVIDGDLGDCIAALPTIRALGGGTMFLRASAITRVKLTRDNWNGIDLLLKAQPYISDVVEWTGNHGVDYNLNLFRNRMNTWLRRGQGFDTNIADWILDTFHVGREARDTPWLTVEPTRVARVVINRTGPGRDNKFCYHNRRFPWRRVIEKYNGNSVFIGSALEHEVFCDVFGDVPYHPTPNLFEAAKVIAGADLFVGNQSSPLWIAYGLFKPALVEVWLNGENSSFHRPGVTLGKDNKVPLPDLP